MDKPLSRFLANVLKNGSITREQAIAFNELATPHLQFEAVMALAKTAPEHKRDEAPSLRDVEKPWIQNTRLIQFAALGVAIPLLHAFWAHTPELKRSESQFLAAPSAVFLAAPSVPTRSTPAALRPKTESSALPLPTPTPAPEIPITAHEILRPPSDALLNDPLSHDIDVTPTQPAPIPLQQ